jgi:flagellar biosynthesis protein FlhB
MNTDTRAALITARSFFRQMRSYGYTPHQIIRIINELLELVTATVREKQQNHVLAESPVETSPAASDGH